MRPGDGDSRGRWSGLMMSETDSKMVGGWEERGCRARGQGPGDSQKESSRYRDVWWLNPVSPSLRTLGEGQEALQGSAGGRMQRSWRAEAAEWVGEDPAGRGEAGGQGRVLQSLTMDEGLLRPWVGRRAAPIRRKLPSPGPRLGPRAQTAAPLARRLRPAVPVPPLPRKAGSVSQSWQPKAGPQKVAGSVSGGRGQGRWSGGEVLSPGTERMCQAWSRAKEGPSPLRISGDTSTHFL